MTLPQILFTLGLDTDVPQNPAEAAAQKRAEVFERILRHNDWPPSRLRQIPATDLAQQIAAHGGIIADPKLLPDLIEKFLEEVA